MSLIYKLIKCYHKFGILFFDGSVINCKKANWLIEITENQSKT